MIGLMMVMMMTIINVRPNNNNDKTIVTHYQFYAISNNYTT